MSCKNCVFENLEANEQPCCDCNDFDKFIASLSGTLSAAKHYQVGTLQPIQIMQEQMTAEQFIGYLRGNVLKYACRIGRKDDAVKDAEKIQQYSLWLVQALKGEKIQP